MSFPRLGTRVSTVLSLSLVAGASMLALGADEPPPKRAVALEVDHEAMVEIPAGTFAMGVAWTSPSPYGDAWSINQTPEHDVILPELAIDAREVSVAQYALFLSHAGGEAHFHPSQPIERVEEGYLPVAGTAEQPIRQVRWHDARAYCAWAGKRLPTEAEWERAATGTEGRTYPWGDEGPDCGGGNHFSGGRSFCHRKHLSAGGPDDGATPEGVDGMAGGVAEWTADWYGPYPAEAQDDPTGPEEGELKVVRGGSFHDAGRQLRTKSRRPVPPGARSDGLGFRCAWREGVTQPARRGELSPPEDVGREPSPRPYAPATARPEVIAEDLQRPGALARTGDGWYVADVGAGRVLEVADGSASPILEDLREPSDLALAPDGTLYVADREAGDLWRRPAGGAAERVRSGEDRPTHVAVTEDALYWATPESIRELALGGDGEAPVTLADSIDGVAGIAPSDSHIYFAVFGDADSANARIARVPRGGGEVEEILVNDALPHVGPRRHQPRALALSPDGTQLAFTTQQDRFPNASLVCLIGTDRSGFDCSRYGPAHVGALDFGGDHVYWITRRAVARASLGDAAGYEAPGLWTSPAGLVAGDGWVAWTDDRDGRLYHWTE